MLEHLAPGTVPAGLQGEPCGIGPGSDAYGVREARQGLNGVPRTRLVCAQLRSIEPYPPRPHFLTAASAAEATRRGVAPTGECRDGG